MASYIRELSDVDPGPGTAWRYPVDREGDPSLPATIRRINLRHFADVMERMSSMLEASSAGISEMAQWKWDAGEEGRQIAAEMAREMRDEYAEREGP
jgi:hypothetical protein